MVREEQGHYGVKELRRVHCFDRRWRSSLASRSRQAPSWADAAMHPVPLLRG